MWNIAVGFAGATFHVERMRSTFNVVTSNPLRFVMFPLEAKNKVDADVPRGTLPEIG
jgi:hypothetical protein